MSGQRVRDGRLMLLEGKAMINDDERIKLSSNVWNPVDWLVGIAWGACIVAIILFLMAAFAHANATERHEAHSIPWFQQHTAARHEALRLCRDDHRLAAHPVKGLLCANAEKAEARAYGQRQLDAFRQMDRPEWWSQNPHSRASILTACQRRAPYDAYAFRYCKPAQDSARAS